MGVGNQQAACNHGIMVNLKVSPPPMPCLHVAFAVCPGPPVRQPASCQQQHPDPQSGSSWAGCGIRMGHPLTAASGRAPQQHLRPAHSAQLRAAGQPVQHVRDTNDGPAWARRGFGVWSAGQIQARETGRRGGAGGGQAGRFPMRMGRGPGSHACAQPTGHDAVLDGGRCVWLWERRCKGVQVCASLQSEEPERVTLKKLYRIGKCSALPMHAPVCLLFFQSTLTTHIAE